MCSSCGGGDGGGASIDPMMPRPHSDSCCVSRDGGAHAYVVCARGVAGVRTGAAGGARRCRGPRPHRRVQCVPRSDECARAPSSEHGRRSPFAPIARQAAFGVISGTPLQALHGTITPSEPGSRSQSQVHAPGSTLSLQFFLFKKKYGRSRKTA